MTAEERGEVLFFWESLVRMYGAVAADVDPQWLDTMRRIVLDDGEIKPEEIDELLRTRKPPGAETYLRWREERNREAL